MKRLTDYIPERYRAIEELADVLQALQPESDAWRAAVRDFLAQANINTATWGLAEYEERYGLPVAPEGRTDEERRGTIRAKRRAVGVIDEAAIERICAGYVNGEVRCTSNPGKMTITVEFLGEMGVPSNIDDLFAVLRPIIAAYTGIDWKFKYLLIRDIHEVMPLVEMESTPIRYFAMGRYE